MSKETKILLLQITSIWSTVIGFADLLNHKVFYTNAAFMFFGFSIIVKALADILKET